MNLRNTVASLAAAAVAGSSLLFGAGAAQAEPAPVTVVAQAEESAKSDEEAYPNYSPMMSAGLPWVGGLMIAGGVFLVGLIVTIFLSGRNSRHVGQL
ncbi:hypothetical protein QP027_02040 [Corynebacterium breve]|uniref:Secreted protein n=1 Tax=Corynebacterium breve TaxID=3049799 RepID=A0ABY8VFC8_9CORY|nr:hypothetical protein [Corynebacterium breve]WIM68204.1 hypothetical protein QP027_02040 [Corynebacterium breve]